MRKRTDPFERAVARAEKLGRRAAAFQTRAGIMRFAMFCMGALGVGWFLILAVHWTVFPEPRWLVIAHSLGFALVVGYYLILLAFLGLMKRRRPDIFGG